MTKYDELNTQQAIEAFLKEKPESSLAEVATGTGKKAKSVSAMVSMMSKSGAVSGKTDPKIKAQRYKLTGKAHKPAPAKPKPKIDSKMPRVKSVLPSPTAAAPVKKTKTNVVAKRPVVVAKPVKDDLGSMLDQLADSIANSIALRLESKIVNRLSSLKIG